VQLKPLPTTHIVPDTTTLTLPCLHLPRSLQTLSWQQYGFSLSFFSNKLHLDYMDIDLSSGEFEKSFGAHYDRDKIGNRVTYETDTRRSAGEVEEWLATHEGVMVRVWGRPHYHHPFCDSLCSSLSLRHRINLSQTCTPGRLGPHSPTYRGRVVKEVER
jgi:hypothetical protein